MNRIPLTQEAEVTPEIRFGHNERQRHYDDTTTWLAEVLEGSMRTSFEYTFDGHELFGRDGGALGIIFKDSVKDAELIAAKNPNLAFELRRRKIEKSEYADMVAMAKGELPNTMVVVSDFPPELMGVTQDIGGYNTRRKQTMLRVISRSEDGTITMRSQSLDRSNRKALEAIYGCFELVPRAGELLGQRIHMDLPSEDRTYLIDLLTGIYDNSLISQYGGGWYGGRTPAEMANTYDFVRSQGDLIDAFVAEKLNNPSQAESLRYGLAAAMEARFTNRLVRSVVGLAQQVFPHRPVPLHEMEQAGREARARGKTFSACGLTEDGQEGLSTEGQLAEAGLGNKTTTETSYKFDKFMYCRECQPAPKKEDKKRLCGPCGICKPCDAKLRAQTKKAA